MSKILVILVLCQVHLIMAQSKKNQIEQLQYTADSLNRVIDMDRNTNKQKIQELNSALITCKTKILNQEISIDSLNSSTQSLINQLNLKSKELNQLNESIKAYEAEIKTLEETNALIQMKNNQLEKEKQNRIECEEREETNTEDVESPKLISTCTFRNIKIRTESVANLRNGAYTSSYEYFKNNQSINPSEIFNSKIIELESLLNKKFKSEFLTLSKDPNSEGCLDYTLYENVTFDGEVTNDFRYNNIDIDFSNGSNTIIFSRSFGLPGACQSLDIASVEFSIAELEPYFAE
jgi:hypothetical protein